MYHTDNGHVEHIWIIITSAQEADNVILTLDQPLSTIWVRIIKTAGNIGIYCPRVFRVRSDTNQSHYPEYDWERLSSSSTQKVKGLTSDPE